MDPTDISRPSVSSDPPQKRSSTPDDNAPPNDSPQAGCSNDEPHEVPRMTPAAANRHEAQQQRRDPTNVLGDPTNRLSIVGAGSRREADDPEATASSSEQPRPTEEMSEKAKGKLPLRSPCTPPPETPNATPDEHNKTAGANDFGLTPKDREEYGALIPGMMKVEGFSEDAVKLWIETHRQSQRAGQVWGVDLNEDSSGDDRGAEGGREESVFDDDDMRRAIEASRRTDTHQFEGGSIAGPGNTDSKREADDDSEHSTSHSKRSRLTTDRMSEKAKGKLPVRDPPALQRSDAALSASEHPPGYESMGSSHLPDEQQAAITTARQNMRGLFQLMRRSGYSQREMANFVWRKLASGFESGELEAGSAEGGVFSWATDEHGFSDEEMRRAKQMSLQSEQTKSDASPSGTYAHTHNVPADRVVGNLVDEGEEAEVPQDFTYYSD